MSTTGSCMLRKRSFIRFMRANTAVRNRIGGLAWTMAVMTLIGIPRIVHATTSQQGHNVNDIVRLLADGQPVFGIRSGEKTAAQAASVAKIRESDFVFYSLEQAPFDLPQMRVYMNGLREGAGQSRVHPLALRSPSIRDDATKARSRVQQALDAGVAAIVYPHVEIAEHAAVAVSAMGAELWPGNEHGQLVNMLIVEDRIGVQNARDIVRTPGVSVVFAGPGDLRRAYDDDMVAVEDAIQTILSACKEFDVPCGITAGVDDIAERIRQGFRVFIVRDVDELTAGRVAAGRRN